MSKINVLLVGLGNIGYQYDQNSEYIQTHFKAINYNKNYNLIGIIEKNKKKISRLKKIHKINIQTKVSKKILKFVNLVVLAVPTNVQFKILNDILNMGYKKNFVLEKPFTTNPNEINKICKMKRQKFFINYYRNYDDRLISFLNKIKQKKKLKIYVEYSKGFFHNFSHYLNLFIKIFGDIKKIKFNKISFPLLILPFLSKGSEVIGKKINVKFNNFYFLLNFNINISSNLLDQTLPEIVENIEINIIENEDNFSEQEWKNLYKLSEETFVEETDSLKQSAAGAGLTDND